MTATKQKPASDFVPGAFYKREGDGMLMIEVTPGQYVNEIHARLHFGISPRNGSSHGESVTRGRWCGS